MKKPIRLIVVTIFVLAAMAFSAAGVLARVTGQGSSIPSVSKNEVTGVITALDANSLAVAGTRYVLEPESKVPAGLKPGDQVDLQFSAAPDGALIVVAVDRSVSSDETAEPTATPEPTGTLNPSPTEKPTESVDTDDQSEGVEMEDNSGNQNDQGDQNNQGDQGNQNNQGTQNNQSQKNIGNTTLDFKSAPLPANPFSTKPVHIDGGSSLK